MTRTDPINTGRMRQPASAVLGCYSNFTFLTGAAHPDEMVATAAALGWQAIGIADVNSLAGIVRAHCAGVLCGRILWGSISYRIP